MLPTPTSRRQFLRHAAFAGAGLALPLRILADPYAPIFHAPAGKPVRVRGRVRAGRANLAGVSVTDGVSVVRTGADGRYELTTTDAQPFVHIGLPDGYQIPQNAPGTARFYQPIAPNARGEMDASFDLEATDAGSRHRFVVLADTQTQTPYEMGLLHDQTVPDVISTVQELGSVAFGVACGDIMFDDLSLYPEYERAVSRMGVPFFQVVGNHDLDFSGRSDLTSTETFCGRFGPRYYSFERGEVHYVVLDDVFYHGKGYIGYLDDIQLTWLAADLATVEAGRTVIVLTHIPGMGTASLRNGAASPDISGSITNRERLYRLLEPYTAHLITGHTHEHEHVFEGGVHEHVLGTACGAWWSGPICYDGTPSGYAVFEMDGSDVSWRYKSTGMPFDHQLRIYPRGSDPTAPDEIVANVWDADPEWEVVWYEDGERKGRMGQRLGLDPMSIELHAGPELPSHRPWVEPRKTQHLFYAPVSPEANSIRVEARDRFGRVYSATL
ncbi:MAG: calcineurin-like phosphoesterase family protein [Rhodothermales bacterium]